MVQSFYRGWPDAFTAAGLVLLALVARLFCCCCSALLPQEQPMGLQEAIWRHLGANYKLGVKLEQQLSAQPCVEKIVRY